MTDTSQTEDVDESEGCDHPAEMVVTLEAPVDFVGDGRVRMWAECECGAPTIATLRIESVEYDDGSDEELYGGVHDEQ